MGAVDLIVGQVGNLPHEALITHWPTRASPVRKRARIPLRDGRGSSQVGQSVIKAAHDHAVRVSLHPPAARVAERSRFEPAFESFGITLKFR